MIKLLKAEKMKLKRTPVWLVFLFMPVLPALLGTMNYLNNVEILQSEWYSLWTQHTLFTCYFFLPVTVGVYCAYIMRMENNNHNWNKALTMPYSRSAIFIAKLLTVAVIILMTQMWISVLFIVSGYAAGLANPPYALVITFCSLGTLGGIVMAAMQLLISIYIKSFAVSVGISFAGGISGLLFLVKKLGHIWPYSLMAYGMHANNANQEIAAGDYVKFIVTAAIYIAVITITGAALMRKKDI